MEFGLVNFGGLASGLDTKALIDAILAVERRPLERLQSRESEFNQRKSALDEMRGKLNGFLTTLQDLTSGLAFRGRQVTVSDETFFTATAGTGADTGQFSVEVLDLAAANKVASNGLAASDQSLVSEGTITIQSGAGEVITIDVAASSANDNLEAVRDAINDADAGVAASVLFDGSEYKLIVRAEESGTENSLTITDSTNLGLDDPLNELIAAADSRITVDTIEITSSTNQVTGVIAGVTLDLLATNAGEPVTLQVSDDTEGVSAAVQSLIDGYNEASRFFQAQFDRDNPGPLARESFARGLQATLQRLVTGGVEGVPFGGIRSLASLGVGFDAQTGELTLDTAELTDILDTRFDEVADLFVSAGSAADARIGFLGAGDAAAGSYAVQISQPGLQASVLGSAPIRPQGIVLNETLTIDVNGDSVDVDLLRFDTTDEIVDKINTALTAAGIGASASNEGGALRISTTEYGSDQTITVNSNRNDNGNGRKSGFDDNNPSIDTGQDVAGTIGGLAATGAGRILTGDEGDVAGLSINVTATAADVTATGGDFGLVSFSKGLTQSLINELTEVTRFGDGRIDSAKSILDGQLKRTSDEIRRLEERLVGREARLIRTFAEAERAISILQSQQAQLGSL